MTTRRSTWRGALPRAVLLAVGVALIPLPVAAGDPAKPSKPPTLQAAMSKIVARDVAASKATPAVARSATQAATPGKDSPAFFKSGAGIAVLAVLAIGAGYAIYSTSNDRVKSPAKK